MIRTILKFELKKLFLAKVNLLAMAGAAVMLVVLAISSVSEEQPAVREAARALDGRVIDGSLFEELGPALRFENGTSLLQVKDGYEKYVPVLNMMLPVTGDDFDFSRFQGTGFYELRNQKIEQRLNKQELTREERAYWEALEEQVEKPFIYHYHMGPANLLKAFQALGFFILLLSAVGLSGVYARETADNMNQLLLCSRYGKRELYFIKFASGLAWILAAALIMLLALLIPYGFIFGMEGTEEMLQLVKPLSMLPHSIGWMLAVCTGIFLMAAVLFASLTMLLSVLTQNALVVTGVLLGYLIVDLFGAVPDRLKLLEALWSLRPNAILMNTGFVNYRLIRLGGRFFLNFEAAPMLYLAVVIAALLIGRLRYRRLEIG